MAKSQKRSSREQKKPKQSKPKAAPPSTFASVPGKPSGSGSGKKK
jgi:hypothetical protein